VTRHTLAHQLEFSGTGLHTSAATTVRLVPAAADTGVVFVRSDRAEADPLPASVESVTDTDRHIVLGEGADAVHTVEHLLAAVAAHGIDDLRIELDGPEPPAGDGSAGDASQHIEEAGVVAQDGTPRTFRLQVPMTIKEGEATYVVAPADELRLTVTIEHDHPLVGRQSGCYDITPEAFTRELSRARTYGFAAEQEELLARGLAQGASTANTIVLTDDGIAAGDLRWPDEFVRHKAVDLLGDLALLGGRFTGSVTAFRPSHAGNVALVRAIKRVSTLTAPYVAGIQEILGTLPHRYPLLLVDRIIEIEEGKRLVGLKNVTINEPFFQGHFPDHPIMPGVLIVEAMAQAGGMMLMGSIENPQNKVVYFMSIDNVKFRRPVTPGDQLRFELEMLKLKRRICQMRGVAYVDGQPVAEAEFMASIIDR